MTDADDLPDGWALVTLKDVADNSKAKAEPGERDDAPYLGLEHIEGGTSRIIGQGVGGDVKSVKNAFQAGDILYGKLRPYLNKVCRPDFDGICSTDILVLKPKACIDPAFLHRVLTTQAVVEYAVANSNGINLPRTSYDALSQFEFALPPLAEQRRIVAKVEELTARSRAARAALAEVPTLLEQFRQSVLASAFRGDLTADWRAKNPNAEPVSVLLDLIRAERRKQWETKYPKKEYIAPKPVDDSDLPELPEGWCWCELALLGEDLFNPIQTGPFGAQLHSSEFVTEGVPVIAVGNLTGHGFSRENLYFITQKKSELLSRYAINAGDLLFARSGATLGKVCVAPDYVDDWRMTGHILRARLNQRLIRSRLVALAIWGMPAVKVSVTSRVRGMTRPGFNTTLLEEIPIPIPPLPEQDELLHKLDDAFSKIDQIETSIDMLVSDLDALDQSILAKAFRGELVPQDPADEPAAALLARIRSGVSATRSVERGRVKFSILLLLRTWNKPLGREMLERGLVLMLNADVRRAILGRSKPAPKRGKKSSTPPRFVAGLDALLGEMLDDGDLVPGPEAGFFAEGQHGFDLAAAPKADLDAVRETAEAMKVIHKDKLQATDADIVSALHGEIYELVS